MTPPCPQSRRLQAAWKQALSHAAWGSTRPVEVLFSERWYSAVPYVRTPHVQMLGCRPMVSNNSAGPIVRMADVKTDGYVDSKTTKEDQRETLFSKLKKADYIAWDVISVSPESLSADMLKKVHAPHASAGWPCRISCTARAQGRKSLNEISFDNEIALVKRALDKGLNITELYVDTVGNAATYQQASARALCGARSTHPLDLLRSRCSARSSPGSRRSLWRPKPTESTRSWAQRPSVPRSGTAFVPVEHSKGRWSGSASSVAAPRGSGAQCARSGWWACIGGVCFVVLGALRAQPRTHADRTAL